jgi:hypothetical protein
MAYNVLSARSLLLFAQLNSSPFVVPTKITNTQFVGSKLKTNKRDSLFQYEAKSNQPLQSDAIAWVALDKKIV